MPDNTIAARARVPDTDELEDSFRYHVRDILGLSWDARNDTIYAELRRLKREDACIGFCEVNSCPVHGIAASRSGKAAVAAVAFAQPNERQSG